SPQVSRRALVGAALSSPGLESGAAERERAQRSFRTLDRADLIRSGELSCGDRRIWFSLVCVSGQKRFRHARGLVCTNGQPGPPIMNLSIDGELQTKIQVLRVKPWAALMLEGSVLSGAELQPNACAEFVSRPNLRAHRQRQGGCCPHCNRVRTVPPCVHALKSELTTLGSTAPAGGLEADFENLPKSEISHSVVVKVEG